MKFVAKLVSFHVTTRVLVSEGASEDEIILKARANILSEPDNILIGDNVTELEDDYEMPFGTGVTDETSVKDVVRIRITGGNPIQIGNEYDATINERGMATVYGLQGGVYNFGKYEIL
jgi:predicted ThiF/HesA family dinucleotide-utilizing enzyme